MLRPQVLYDFMHLYEEDLGGPNPYSKGIMTLSIDFRADTGTGKVKARVHIQWQLLDQLLKDFPNAVVQVSQYPTYKHLTATIPGLPGIEYVAVKHDGDE